MKKLFLFILFLGISQCFAQIKMFIQAGPFVESWKSKEFTQFKIDYNHNPDLSPQITKPFKEEGSIMSLGNQVCIGFNFKGIGVTSGRYHVTGSQSVGFYNGEERLLKFTFSDWYTELLLGYGNDDFFISFAPGMQLRSGILRSYYKYPNGIKSMGNERDLNGQYHALRIHFSLGLAAGVNLDENFALVGGVQWFPGSVSRGNVNDLSLPYEKNNGNDTFGPSIFPKDYNSFVHDNLSGDAMRMDQSSLRFTIGLRASVNMD
jgi:hypothetical protein